jgi:FKBP-type peptidyl-prolyl cis-trans isomerase
MTMPRLFPTSRRASNASSVSLLAVALLTFGAASCKKAEEPKKEAPAVPAKPEEPPKPAADPKAPADVKAVPADAEKTASGLASKQLSPGTGTDKPAAADTVTVHYTGWTTDGVKFDSSLDRAQPAKFPLNQVIKGWTEGLQLMTVGEKRRFWIPGGLAYGDTPTRPGAPAGTLVFDVELLGFDKAPEVPPDVAEAPKTAKKTKSGLAYRVLKKGTGKDHPKASSTVEVHYSGWTIDGKMFDSSVARGEPAVFPLGGVIPGWTEGVQLMTVGEKTRFWIPGKLAYGDTPSRPGAPAGTLVFDVELLSIK